MTLHQFAPYGEEVAELLADLAADWRPFPGGEFPAECQRCPSCAVKDAVVAIRYRLGGRTYEELVCAEDATFTVRDARRADAQDVTVLVPVDQGQGRAA